jgi:hypothetical protein
MYAGLMRCFDGSVVLLLIEACTLNSAHETTPMVNFGVLLVARGILKHWV